MDFIFKNDFISIYYFHYINLISFLKDGSVKDVKLKTLIKNENIFLGELRRILLDFSIAIPGLTIEERKSLIVEVTNKKGEKK